MIDNEIVNDYIDERINENYALIRNSKSYKEKIKTYNKIYDSLCEKLSNEDKKEFEHVIAIKGDIVGLEVYLAYQIGINDIINLNKCNLK